MDDALRHETYWFRPDEVWCAQCRTTWEVRRVIGSDFLLKVIKGEAATIGWQQPLADWYDLMKAGLQLMAKEDPSIHLEPGEELYIQSRQAGILVEEDSPLLGQWTEGEAPSHKEGDIGLAFMQKWDRGQLLLTSERLIWKGTHGHLTFWLKKTNSVHTEVTWYLGLMYGLCRYKFRFRQESILKWLTYIALAARRIEQRHRHRISISNY